MLTFELENRLLLVMRRKCSSYASVLLLVNVRSWLLFRESWQLLDRTDVGSETGGGDSKRRRRETVNKKRKKLLGGILKSCAEDRSLHRTY
jgi:hypothetical protein